MVLLIQTVTYSLSTLGNHTFAVIQGAEQYEIIKNGFGVVLQEINNLIAGGFVEVNGETIELNFFLGGDYKVCLIINIILYYNYFLQFLLLIMGFNAAHSNYSCIYCIIKKDERLKNVKITINVPLKLYATSNRYNTDINPVVYQREKGRTLDSICKCVDKKQNFGVIHEPMINIEVKKVESYFSKTQITRKYHKHNYMHITR